MRKRTIFYATQSPFKKEELAVISRETLFSDRDGQEKPIGDLLEFELTATPTSEPLEVDLEKMVRHKVKSAYRSLLAPCIVEHAGLIFDAYASKGFPGGLTQPMWDTLQADDFLERLSSIGEGVTARAIVGYCSGKSVETFVGEVHGTLQRPKGNREFYWDTVFCPDGGGGRSYAEIVGSGPNGLSEKMKISQSGRAMALFAKYVCREEPDGMFASF